MTPEQKRQHDEMYTSFKQRKVQQIAYPLDPASEEILSIPDIQDKGTDGTGLTQSYGVVGGAGGTVTAPKAYTAALTVVIDGNVRRIPLL